MTIKLIWGEIAKFVLNNFNKSTFDGEFDALFAVQSVPMLIRYYKIFKSLNLKISYWCCVYLRCQ